MTKTLILNIPAQGHVNPSLPVVAELVQRGEEVVYVNTEAYRAQVEVTGARFVAYPPIPELVRLSEHASDNIPLNMVGLVEIGERLLAFTRDLLQQEQPDCLIYDSLAGWGLMAARSHPLPTVSFIATFAINIKAMPPMSMGAMLQTGFQMIQVIPRYLRTSRRIKRTYGVKSVGLMEAVMSLAQLNIVFTSSAFQPGAESFADTFKFVGTALNLRPKEVDFPLDALTGKPLIYISLGTINNQNLDFYRACLTAFADHPGQIVLSAGKQTVIDSLGEIPPNFIVRNFVPQLDILQRADLFITHGGLNSVHEGLYYGVPLVVIPQQAEQAIVAQQVAKHGVGLALRARPPYGQVTAHEVRAAADTALGTKRESYHAAAVRLGDTLREAGGAARAVDEIQAFVKTQS